MGHFLAIGRRKQQVNFVKSRTREVLQVKFSYNITTITIQFNQVHSKHTVLLYSSGIPGGPKRFPCGWFLRVK